MNTSALTTTSATPRGLGWRVLDMTLLWAGFGIAIGPGSAPPGSNWIGLIAGIIAGLIILPPLGALLGLCGGRWKESLIGGTIGAALALTGGLIQGTDRLPMVGNVGLIYGGLLGATFLGLFYRLPCLLLRKLKKSPQAYVNG